MSRFQSWGGSGMGFSPTRRPTSSASPRTSAPPINNNNYFGSVQYDNPTGRVPRFSGAYDAGTGRFDIGRLMKYLDKTQAAARQANETRYQQGLDTLRTSMSQAEEALTGQGVTAKADIQQRLGVRKGDIAQGLMDRGLYSTTVLDNLQTEATSLAERDMGAVDEAIAAQRSGLYSAGGRSIADFIANREDPYPDMGQFLPFILQLQQGQAVQDETSRAAYEDWLRTYVASGGQTNLPPPRR